MEMTTTPRPLPGVVTVYHLTKLEHAKSSIQFGRMKIATFSDANDPFELLALNLRGRKSRPLRKALNRFRKEQAEEIGMLCFSRSWASPVLWSLR